MRAAIVFVALAAACTPRPQVHRTAMQQLPGEPESTRQKIVVHERGAFTLTAEGTILCSADDPSLINVYGGEGGVRILGRKRGKTTLHMKRRGEEGVETADVDVEVIDPEPDVYALAVGEILTLPTKDVREFSSSGPEIVAVELADDGNLFVVTGKRAGMLQVLLIHKDDSKRTVQFEVVGGDKQL